MKSLRLDQVTLVSVTSVDLPATELAMMISMHDIQFGEVKLLTSEEYIPQDPRIHVVKIPELDFEGYSRFILNDLHGFIDTDYCLVIQADGFILNAHKWQDQFLDYDYIGAPWPKILALGGGDQMLYLKNQVGNGGFSLRSKKLLKETANINWNQLPYPTKSEDLIICHFLFEEIIKSGMKFPSPEFAAQFSIESENASYGQNPSTSFGFHGKQLRDLIFNSIQHNGT